MIFPDLILYNVKHGLSTIKEILAILLKEVVINKNPLFKRYLKDRLALYSVRKLRKKYTSKTILWVHANNLGEVNAAVRLSKILKDNLPALAIIVSTTELAAYKIVIGAAKEIDEAFFLPFDIPFLIKRVFKSLRPKLFITVEAGLFYPNLFLILNRLGIKTMLLNGWRRFIDKRAEDYMISKKLLTYSLNKIDFLGMRSREVADDLIKLGLDEKNIAITGQFRLDMPADVPGVDEKNHLFERLYINKDRDIIIAGCTWHGEDEIFLRAFKDVIEKYPKSIMIIAPRHINRVEEICDLVQRANMVPKRRSSLDVKPARDGEVIILDTYGELYELYGIAKLSIIGASFICYGGGNITEPLLRGSPVITGPYTRLWGNLVEEMKITSVHDYRELKGAIEYFLDNPNQAIASRDYALKVINRHRGAYKKSVDTIEKMLSSK